MARGRGASAGGGIRTVEISKGSSHFHASSLIPAAAESTFDWLAASGLGEPTIDESTFVVRAGDLLEKMNTGGRSLFGWELSRALSAT